MFADEDKAAKLIRDPVAPAKRSKAAMKKVITRTLDDGSAVHSFKTLMQDLQTIVRNTCCTAKGAKDAPTFDLITTPTPKQKHALELIGLIKLLTERGTSKRGGFIGEMRTFWGRTSD